MALWRDIGKVEMILAGRTHQWQVTYDSFGHDVGVVVIAPNIKEPQVNRELVASEQGVVAREGQGDQSGTHYTVKIRNAGTGPINYNLHIGDWLPEGSQPPVAHLLKKLPPFGGGGVEPPIAIAAKKRGKRAGGRGKKRARRR